MKPHRLYHFRRNRYISTNVNHCPAVDKEKAQETMFPEPFGSE